MELKILIPMGDINKLIDSGDKLFDKNYDSRVVDVVRDSEVEFGFGVQFSGVTSLFLLFYHLYYLTKIPQMLLEILVIIYFTTNIPEAFGEFWSIIKMNFID